MANQKYALEPARGIIERLGGVEHVAALTGKHRSRVFRWMYPRERGGTGGLIPMQVIPALLGYAQKNAIKLDANDFFERDPRPRGLRRDNDGRQQHGKERRQVKRRERERAGV